MTEKRSPVIVLLTSSWVSMLGVALATTAGFSWAFVLPMHVQGDATNPYIGLLVVFAIPALLLLGLILIPLGIWWARRRAPPTRIDEKRVAWRKLGIFFGLMTFVNVVIGSQATYRSVKYMETQKFCGASCHVMKPEYTAYGKSAHSRVECVACHVEPGTEGYVKAKMAGTRQLIMTVFNSFPRPIASGLESNRLARSSETCENCHARGREIGNRVRVLTKFASDEANTRTYTVLTMMGVHKAHLRAGLKIRYAAADAKRQSIPWVEATDGAGKATVYESPGLKAETLGKLAKFDMQCVDCHNRPAHSFELPERALDRALADGRVPADLPYVRKQGLALMVGSASDALPGKLDEFYKTNYPAIYSARHAEIGQAGQALAELRDGNVFPDLKVTWGTYPNNLGHMDTPGCFRCHDGDHSSADKKVISNDCSVCHQVAAVDEAAPPVLDTLGLVATRRQ